MEKISTCLWFDTEAEEAAKFYTSVFKNSKLGQTARYDKASSEAAKRPEGSVMTVTFQLEGRDFMALNGGPLFKFNESVSLMVGCKNQEEIDYYWNKLTGDGGKESMCGWLKDKYGLSWQIIPENLGQLMSDPEKGKRVMAEVMKMKKLDMKKMEAA